MSTNRSSYFARGLASSALLAVAAFSSAQYSLNVVTYPIKPAYTNTNAAIPIATGAAPKGSVASAVNAFGQVAGNASYNSSSAAQGVYTGALGAAPSSVAPTSTNSAATLLFTALSSTGIGAGTAGFVTSASANTTQAFRYTGGTLTSVGALVANGTSRATGVNASGTVVGASSNGTTTRGFYATLGGSPVDIGALTATGDSIANAINDAGTIVGASGSTAIIYQGGTMNALQKPTDALNASATALSQTGGYIAGNFLASTFVQNTYLNIGATATSAGTTTAIPLLFAGKSMTVTGVNSLGWVVGYTTTSTNANTAFLYANGTLINLSTLLPTGYGFGSAAVTGISDNGYLSATLSSPTSNGTFAALLQITPQAVPEPTTLAALGLGAVALLRRRRKA